MITVVTAIYGGRDRLRTPHVTDVPYICFTDNPKLTDDVWKCRYVPPQDDDRCRAAKRFKVLIHEYVDTPFSLWVDASFELRCDPKSLCRLLEGHDIGLVTHGRRRPCLYHEAKYCRERKRDNAELIQAQMAHYRAEGHPEHYGLWMGGFIVRRNNEAVRNFNRMWWDEIKRWSRRDQISLPFALRKSGIRCKTFTRREATNWYKIRSHVR